MKSILTLLLLTTLSSIAQDAPFTPQPIVPGGIILPLYAPTSPLLKHERIHEPENYNSATGGKGPITNVINIHNPSI